MKRRLRTNRCRGVARHEAVATEATPPAIKIPPATTRMIGQAPRGTPRHGELIPPDQLFGRPLPRLCIIDADRPFEERVERAWHRILATRFTPEEHERLREVLVEMLKVELREPGSTR